MNELIVGATKPVSYFQEKPQQVEPFLPEGVRTVFNLIVTEVTTHRSKYVEASAPVQTRTAEGPVCKTDITLFRRDTEARLTLTHWNENGIEVLKAKDAEPGFTVRLINAKGHLVTTSESPINDPQAPLASVAGAPTTYAMDVVKAFLAKEPNTTNTPPLGCTTAKPQP